MWKIGGIMEKINRKELKKSKKLVKFMWKGRKEVYIIKNKVIQKKRDNEENRKRKTVWLNW